MYEQLYLNTKDYTVVYCPFAEVIWPLMLSLSIEKSFPFILNGRAQSPSIPGSQTTGLHQNQIMLLRRIPPQTRYVAQCLLALRAANSLFCKHRPWSRHQPVWRGESVLSTELHNVELCHFSHKDWKRL